MDWELVKPWVNRVGIVVEFVSFWFAAPEVVTEIRGDEGAWLRALERRAERVLTWSVLLLSLVVPGLCVGVLPVAFSTGILAELEEWTGVELLHRPLWLRPVSTATALAVLPVWAIVIMPRAQAPLAKLLGLSPRERNRWAIALMTLLPAMGLGTDWARGELTTPVAAMVWGQAIASAALMWVLFLLMVCLGDRLDKVLASFLRVLADDKRVRQRSLAVGAVLFVVGSLLQLVATF